MSSKLLDELEKGFLTIYLYDPKLVFGYYEDETESLNSFIRKCKSYITKNYRRFADMYFFDSSLSGKLSSNVTKDIVNIDDDFLLKIRTIGFRVSFSSIPVFGPGNNILGNKLLNLLGLFMKDLEFSMSVIDMSCPYVAEYVLRMYDYSFDDFNIMPSVEKIRKVCYDNCLSEDNFLRIANGNPYLFSEICKFILNNESEHEKVSSFWPDLLRSLHLRQPIMEVLSSAESIWAILNFPEYKTKRVSKIKKLSYLKRAVVLSAVIKSGNADKRTVRMVRSDSSLRSSFIATKCLFDYRYMYQDDFWKDMVVSLCDTRYSIVATYLTKKMPKDLLMYLVGNAYVNKDILFERYNEK